MYTNDQINGLPNTIPLIPERIAPDAKTVARIRGGVGDPANARFGGSYVDDGLSGSETEGEIPQMSDLESDSDASTSSG